jgi:hypothetical protein
MILTTFKSTGRAYVWQELDCSWTEIANLLTEHIDRPEKTATPMFNFAEFKKLDDPTTELGRSFGEFINNQWYEYPNGEFKEIPGTIRRCKENVVAINGIVLDVDQNYTIEQAQELYQHLEYVLYTTFNHTPDKHKFRIVIPFTQPLLAKDIAGYKESIKETFPLVDSASFTVSQSFYFHSGKEDSRSYRNDGVMLDPYKHFEYREPKIWHPRPNITNNTDMTTEQAEAYKQAVLKSLNTCSGLHYLGDHQHGVLTLVTICKSIGLSYEEFDALCVRMSATDSDSLKDSTKRGRAWDRWNGDRITAQVRDAFINAYGGEPVKVERTIKEIEFTTRPSRNTILATLQREKQ